MFSRLSSALVPRVASRISTASRSRVGKIVVGGATVVGVFNASEVYAAEAEAKACPVTIDPKMLGGGLAVTVIALGMGYFMLQSSDDKKNVAFVFIKPHANTEATKALVKAELAKRNITITGEGEIKGTVIDQKKYIDQHYYSIASKATLLDPKDLPVPADKFQAKFGLRWEDALAQGVVYNAMQACNKFGISADDLDKKWAAAKKAGKLVKFGGGFYCGEIDGIFIFNGFFMSMRSKFTGDAKIYYYTTEWSQNDLKWEDFRGSVLGPTDPADAPADSIRGQVALQWKELGLQAPCNVGDNGVHASASPFEALAECTNWLEKGLAGESFGKKMLSAGISEATIKKWSVDPQVKFAKDGKDGKFSLFDLVEDMDSEECLATLLKVSKFCPCNNA